VLGLLAASVVCDPAIASSRDDLTVTATITTTPGGWVGRITVESPVRTFAARIVEGETCEAVRDGLRLIAEVAIERLPAYEPPSPAAPLVSGSAVASRPAPFAPEPRWHLGIGAHVLGAYGVGPSVAPGAAPFVETVRGPLALRASLGFTHASGDVDVSLSSARFEVCPYRVVLGALELDPLGALDVGVVTGRAETTAHAAWIAPGAGARARWRLHPYFVEIEAGARVPILKPRFYLERGETLFEAPRVALHASAGAGVYLW
jgi:hypothetical protein